jgi:hypothetical protein
MKYYEIPGFVLTNWCRSIASRLAGMPIYLVPDALTHKICKFAVARDQNLTDLFVYEASQTGRAAGAASDVK